MITFSSKSVFDSNCDMIVNTINCHGIMDSGIALEFSLRFPLMYQQYLTECESKRIATGCTYYYEENGSKILNFPTKGTNPYIPSELSFIEKGLDFFVKHYVEYDIQSVTFPPLGCNNGKLDFDNIVKPIMITKLSSIDLDVRVCLNEIVDGLERDMTTALKRINVKELEAYFDELSSFEKFKEPLLSIDRFSQLASHKYLPSVSVYRAIWHHIFTSIKA